MAHKNNLLCLRCLHTEKEVGMSEEVFKMSAKEVQRVEIIRKVIDKQINQATAGKLLGCTDRNIRKLKKSYLKHGINGLLSKKRGVASNRKYPDELKNRALELIINEYKLPNQPKFARDLLEERAGIVISKETARQWLIKGGAHKPKQVKEATIHPPRDAREQFGELIQIDGSPHHWFGEERDEVCLIVFVDDATSRIQQLRFFKAETTFAYFETTKLYIEKYGLPVALYADKHSIFKINTPEPQRSTGITQFGRAMIGLGVTLIPAHSPQAKGKVERKNLDLQRRLIKEMELDGIDTIEKANGEYLDKFAERFNARFARAPAKNTNAHIPVDNFEVIDLHFTHQEPRIVTKNHSLSYKGKILKLKQSGTAKRLSQTRVIVCEAESGEITVLLDGQSLQYEVYDKKQAHIEPVTRKALVLALPSLPRHAAKVHIPAADHPWKVMARQAYSAAKIKAKA